MSAGITPGPWVHSGHGDITDAAITIDIASVYLNSEAGVSDANARLIAAAPELLAALLDCVAVMQKDLNGLAVIQPELRGALAAIAKATGEGA